MVPVLYASRHIRHQFSTLANSTREELTVNVRTNISYENNQATTGSSPTTGRWYARSYYSG
jgi:hypothetical protein